MQGQTSERKENFLEPLDSGLTDSMEELRSLTIHLSEEEYRKVQAATWYNDYPNESAYGKDMLMGVIESDKETHLRSKQNNKIKK